MVGRYFGPTIRRKAVIFPIISIIMVALADMQGIEHGNLAGMVSVGLLAYIIMLSPIMFARQAADEVFCSLPVLGYEKCVFIFGWSFIAIPVLTLLPGEIYVMLFIGDVDIPLGQIIVDTSLISIFVMLSSITAGLWAVFGSRRHRTLHAVLAVFGTELINWSFGFIIGFITAIRSGAGTESLPDNISDSIMSYRVGLFIFWLLFFVFTLIMAARAIARKQV